MASCGTATICAGRQTACRAWESVTRLVCYRKKCARRGGCGANLCPTCNPTTIYESSIDYLSAEDIDATDEYLFGHTMAIIPFALLLPRVEESVIGELHKTLKTTG